MSGMGKSTLLASCRVAATRPSTRTTAAGDHRDPDRDARGRPLLEDDLLVLTKGYWEPREFTVPPMDARWRLALDTGRPTAPEAPVPPGMPVTVGAWSLLLLVGARRAGE